MSIYTHAIPSGLPVWFFLVYPVVTAVVQADELAEIRVSTASDTVESSYPERTVNTADANTPHFSSSIRIEDFVEYLPGVLTGRASAGISSDVEIRGFSVGGRLYKDGLLDNQKLFLRDPATVERIEFIKGHDSVLFGSGSPGGTINYISKKPQSERINALAVSAGSPYLMRMTHDLAGSLRPRADLADTLTYRMVSVVQKGESGIANVPDNRVTLMPALRWKNDNTRLDLSAEYSLRERPFDFDAVLRHGEPVYDISYVDPRNLSRRHNRFLDLDLKHEFSPNLTASVQARKISVNRDERLVGYYYKLNEDDLLGYYREVNNDYDQFSVKSELEAHYADKNRVWRSVLGMEKNQQDGYTDSRRSVGAYILDILDPQFDYPLPQGEQLTDNDYRTLLKDHAVYNMNQLTIGDHWLLKAGVRKSWFSEKIIKTDQDLPQSDSDAVSSSLGISWMPNDYLTLYASQSSSFSPNSPDRKQNLFPPREANQQELGLRIRSADKSWSLDSSLFRIEQDNLAVRDPQDRDLKVLSGEHLVEGFELLAEKKLPHGFSIRAGYSYMNGKITRDTIGLAGNSLNNIPKHSGSFNLRHSFRTGRVKNEVKTARFDLGVVAVGKRQGDRANSFQNDGYARVDLSLYYPLGKKTALEFSVKNLLDENYVAASYGEDLLVMGYPRRTLMTLKHDF